MFTKSAHLYDLIYSAVGKDYAAEAAMVHAIIERYKCSSGNRLLDVACGSGQHLTHLAAFYEPAGLDLDENLLAAARQRCPEVPFFHADMTDFNLGLRFDVITCLFSSIGYVKILPRLNQTLRTFARHLAPGGVLLVEPWFAPDTFYPGRVSAVFVDQPELKVVRMSSTQVRGRLSTLYFYYMVGTPAGVEVFNERHDLGLFTHAEYRKAFQKAGLEVFYEETGLTGRGLYIGRLAP